MFFRESEAVEPKRNVVDNIKKEIIAFANCGGGMLYIGIDDDGEVIGVDNADGTGGEAIVTVNVQRGTNRPYYHANKGLRPEGIYVRQGTSAVPATGTAIKQLFFRAQIKTHIGIETMLSVPVH